MCSFREVKRLYPRSQYGQVSSWENASGVPTQERQYTIFKQMQAPNLLISTNRCRSG